MAEANNQDPIETLKRKLYLREGFMGTVRRSRLSPARTNDLKKDFGPVSTTPPGTRDRSWLPKLLIASVIFFLAAVSVATFVFFKGGNFISGGNIDLAITGPSQIGGGDELSLQILVANRNSSAITTTRLIVEYPEGTRAVDGPALTRTSQDLGTINSGESVNQSARAILFGGEETTKDIVVTLQYRLPDSNAIYDKKTTYSVRVNASPISLLSSLPEDINSNQPLVWTIKARANSSQPLKGILLAANYPPGFTFESATPAPDINNNVWHLGDLKSGAEKTIEIHGRLDGQDNEAKSFRADVGTGSAKDADAIDTVYNSALKTLAIKRPFVNLDLALNGDHGGVYVAQSEQGIKGVLDWGNNLPTALTDVSFQIDLVGQALNQLSVLPANGFYRSGDSTAIWDKTTNPALASVPAGTEDHLSFTLSSVPLMSGAAPATNPTIDLTIHFQGRRLTDNGAPGAMVENTITKTIKLESLVQMTAKALYSIGPFTNTGPLPPKVDQETTYTVTWSLTNSSNLVGRGTVRAVLPVYVKWAGQTSPAAENVDYNETTHEVEWSVDDLEAGAGRRAPARTASFKVILKPSVSQVGDAVELTGPASFSGIDTFTDTTINLTRDAVTTRITSDPAYGFDKEKVAQ